MPKILKLVGFILLCNLVGALGAIFTYSAIPSWYAYLQKPFFSPPNYVFAPVWTLLYTLMGVSLFGIWESNVKGKILDNAKNLFWIQLFLNGIWTPIFFGAKNLGLGLVVIVSMWYFILKTIKAFSKINLWSSIFLYPYLLWVSFASILNFSLWILNK